MPGKVHKSMGIDPGSLSWKFCVLDDNGIIAKEEVDTLAISQEPSILAEIVDRHKEGLEAIGAPSGHGLPVTTVKDVGEHELRLMTLKRKGTSIVGLTKAIKVLKRIQAHLGIRCIVLPSVKHLPTVPRWRKINRVDLGTSDKLCAAASALQLLSEARSLAYKKLSFILCEVGHAFVGMVCVRGGEIVDGIGGTMASYGTRASGTLDAELVHIWHFPDKASVYTGGLVQVAGRSLQEIEDGLPNRLGDRADVALKRFVESFASDALAISSRNNVKSLLVSSVLGPKTNDLLLGSAHRIGLNLIEGIETSASMGSAFLVNGLMGGKYRGLSERLGVALAKGSIMEDIYLSGRPMTS